jgi:hypothetical protein
MISIFTIFGIVKVRGKMGNLLAEDVQMCKQVQGETIDKAMFNSSVPNGTVLIYTASLVVLCIVCQRSEDVEASPLVVRQKYRR